ncbi:MULTISPECIES: LysR family transcriptional regulator [Pseudomonas]|uniref:LysR family transcriptional regulator n=1 Tax=Pseudomonas chlororaphis TaxID=587753 RepID=A0A0D5XY98_9PSED|nr:MULTISPECIES: LysR family transcriptional regulator [Pseudomonas]AJO79594.1 LysR family transcriptional regulator [Pseudomonas sp. MRSN 12121]AKA23674.1 LysR family transcriptional regulator [Pseudomonas chlororaphis]
MSSNPGTPTLDQLRIFLTIVEVGSFAGAARKLHRATSVISYSMANLELQLGVTLFDRKTTRKPQLTEAGRTVLAEARSIYDGIDGLRAKVKGLLQGLEAEVHLVIDVMFPAARIVDALKNFRREFPTVQLHLHMEALGAVAEMVLQGRAAVGVCGLMHRNLSGVERVQVGFVKLIPVAAPQHPLAQAEQNLPGAGREHVQLVLSDRSQLTRNQDFGVVGTHSWRLADLGSKHMLLREGIGWGNMPQPMVEEDLASGRLVLLDLPGNQGLPYGFDAIYRIDTPPGPAASWLIDWLAAQTRAADSGAD